MKQTHSLTPPLSRLWLASRATSVLPIDDTRTIAYGSSGDCTIHNDSEELDSKMTEAGISLNLKKHLVGDKEMALAADIEGHCGTVCRRPQRRPSGRVRASQRECSANTPHNDPGRPLLRDRLRSVAHHPA